MITLSHWSQIGLVAVILFWTNGIKANTAFDNLHPSSTQVSSFIVSDSGKVAKFFKRYYQGERTWGNGNRYVGELRFGRPHGKGTYYYPDGNVYSGTFKNGYRSGWGEHQFPEGDRYEGEWDNGRMQGTGALIFACGHEYLGDFNNDQMDGEGTIILSTGESYSGAWQNGLADGLGTFTRTDGSKYVGLSKQGKRHGEGKIFWMEGDSLLGNWNNGHLDGRVSMHFKNGDQYQSEWENGEWKNQGTYIDQDNNAYHGDLTAIINDLDEEEYEGADENLGMLYYSLSLEYSANHNYDFAMQLMQQADKYTPVLSEQKDRIAMQLELIQVHKGGWAQLNED